MHTQKITKRTLWRAALALGAASALPWQAQAQTADAWPTKPVRVVVAGAPGGGPDILMRVIGQQLSLSLKQPVIVENKPGASGVVATRDVIGAAPDGYSFLFTPAAYTVMAQAMPKKLPYDITKDLAPVVQIGAGGIYLVTNPSFPANNMKEFVAQVKANPNKFSYASFGVGSSGHLVMAALENQTGMKLNHVPYRAMTAIYAEIQNGNIPMGFDDTTSSTQLIKAGKLKVMGVSGSARTVALPDIPTMTEQGFKFDSDGWYGIFAPKGTPEAIVSRVNKEINKILVSPELAARFLQFNLANPPIKTPEQFARTIQDDLKVWTKIVEDNKITSED